MKIKITAYLLIFILQWIYPVHSTRVVINYNDAFDQEAIHQKFKPLLTTLGCAKNIDDTQEQLEQSPIIIALDIQNQQWDEYQQACLNRLNHARRVESLRDVYTYGMTLVSMAAIGTVAWYICPNSYVIFGTIAGCLNYTDREFRELSQSIRSLYSFPPHPLNELEENFALNKCFIPKSLWPSLISAFQATRNNFEREKAMNYIDFTLGLTVFRPRERLPFRDEVSQKQLFNKINIFFEDGHFKDGFGFDKILECYRIQYAVLNVVNTQRFDTPLYIYGLGSNHKERFVNNLYEWLTDGNPNSVLLERFVITSPDELEGSKEKPGVFLQVLRNQCIERKNTSLVLLEGINTDWLNRKDMCFCARRVFEYADHSKNRFSCRYLQWSYGDVYLDKPSMFVVAFGDEQLKDKGLRLRFATMNWHE